MSQFCKVLPHSQSGAAQACDVSSSLSEARQILIATAMLALNPEMTRNVACKRKCVPSEAKVTYRAGRVPSADPASLLLGRSPQ